jgi:hypothetical protein
VPLIYHMTPITPNSRLSALGSRLYGVRFGRHDQLDQVLSIAKGVLFDNGAYSVFTKGMIADWPAYYSWLEPILFHPSRWAIIPDVIAEGGQAQDALINDWPFGHKGVPVWHTGEPIERLLRLLDQWPRVCFGSTDEHWRVGSDVWRSRMDEAWPQVLARHRDPIIHMLRGVAVAWDYPFDSADSSSVGQNSHRYDMPLWEDAAQRHWGAISYANRLENRQAHILRTLRQKPAGPRQDLLL